MLFDFTTNCIRSNKVENYNLIYKQCVTLVVKENILQHTCRHFRVNEEQNTK